MIELVVEECPSAISTCLGVPNTLVLRRFAILGVERGLLLRLLRGEARNAFGFGLCGGLGTCPPDDRLAGALKVPCNL